MKVSNFILKLVAIVTMLIDHAAVACYAVIGRQAYNICRNIGRIAFPLFAFMLVEGFRKTRNRFRYLATLLVLAIISEVPADLVFCTWKYRDREMNILFTLFISLATLMLTDKIRQHIMGDIANVLNTLILVATCYISYYFKFSYGAFGPMIVFLIFYMEELSKFIIDSKYAYNIAAAVGVLIWFIIYDIYYHDIIELYGIPSCVLLCCYNHQRGNYIIPKFVFYLFYPVHLLLLYYLRRYVI